MARFTLKRIDGDTASDAELQVPLSVAQGEHPLATPGFSEEIGRMVGEALTQLHERSGTPVSG